MSADIDIAYRAGRASRALGYPLDRNPYDVCFVRPERLEECRQKREAWDRGWMEQYADGCADAVCAKH